MISPERHPEQEGQTEQTIENTPEKFSLDASPGGTNSASKSTESIESTTVVAESNAPNQQVTGFEIKKQHTEQLRPQDLTFQKFYHTDSSQLFIGVIGFEPKLLSGVIIFLPVNVFTFPLELQNPMYRWELSSFLHTQEIQ